MTPETREHWLELDSTVYSVEAVAKTAYRLADVGVFQIEHSSTGQLRVVIQKCSAGDTMECYAHLKREFLTELTDQLLRERIAVQTEARRNLILAHAYSSSSLSGS